MKTDRLHVTLFDDVRQQPIREAEGEAVGILERRIVSLKHADPVAGPATASAAVLVVSEVPHHMPADLALIDSLDVPRPQFEISVKFVETSLDDRLGTGFNWPTRIGATVADYSQAGTGTVGNSVRPVPDS